MKRLSAIFLLLALLCGCRPQQASETTAATEEPIQTATTQVPSTTAPAPVIQVMFQQVFEDGKEYARITGTDESGMELWQVLTPDYEIAQLDRTAEIGLWQQQYYYVDGGAVVALDVRTGSELWRNPDFGGSPAGQDAACIAEDGTVYLCGFFGPDFYAVDARGQTLVCTDMLDADYYWAHKLILEEDRILVCFSGGPEGDIGPEGHKIPVTLP